MQSPILAKSNQPVYMDKKPKITLTTGRFEPLVFVKVLSITLLMVVGLALAGGLVMQGSWSALIENQGVYRFVLLPFFLAGGVAFITRHSTLTVTNVSKKQLASLVVAALENEGYRLKKDKERAMNFAPKDGHLMKLNQWMENMTVTVKFRNRKMTIVGPRRIINNLEDVVRFNKVFKQALLEVNG